MAIIRQDDALSQLPQTLLQIMVNKQQLEQQQETLKLRKKELDLRTQERDIEMGGLQNILQGLAQELQGGGEFAQQFVGQTPALAGALDDGELSEEELRDPQLLAAAASEAAARQTFMQRRASEDAMRRLGEEAARLGDPSLVGRARTALDLLAAGVDDSLVKDLIPPDMETQVSIQAERMKLLGLEDQREADGEATAYLQRRGILPEGVNLIPGAAQTLLTIAEAREKDAIDWMQEGINFITGRVGDSVTGSPFVVSPDGSLSIGGGGEAVTVDQAVNEWKSIVTQYAPEGAREAILTQLDSGIFTRRLEIGRGEMLASDILANAGETPEVLADIREALSGEFTPSEITAIINKARARARRPRP